jgi:hypothetical protein
MGTWAPSPFGSDMAQDFLEEIGELSQPERLDLLRAVFAEAVEPAGRVELSSCKDEVMAGAALVAISLPHGRDVWSGNRVAGGEELELALLSAPANSLVAAALAALNSVAGRWMEGWTDEECEAVAAAGLAEVREVLLAAGS